MRHVPFTRRFGVWGDDLMGYGKPKPKWQWWMDLEEADGKLQIPKSRDKEEDSKYKLEGADER